MTHSCIKNSAPRAVPGYRYRPMANGTNTSNAPSITTLVWASLRDVGIQHVGESISFLHRIKYAILQESQPPESSVLQNLQSGNMGRADYAFIKLAFLDVNAGPFPSAHLRQGKANWPFNSQPCLGQLRLSSPTKRAKDRGIGKTQARFSRCLFCESG